MNGLLDDRLALITGAGSGIGEAIAYAMADAGARVIAADIDGSAAARTAAGVGHEAVSFACDVTDRSECDGLAAAVRSRIGAVSILVNNAGIIRRGTVMEPGTRADWDATLAVNLDGPYNMVTAFLDQLRDTKGSIINIGSIQSFVALPNSAAYTTSKGGIRLLTKALALELSPLGVLSMRSAPALRRRRSTPRRARTRPTWPILPLGYRSAGSARPRTSPGPPSFSPRTWRDTSPASPCRSMAAISHASSFHAR